MAQKETKNVTVDAEILALLQKAKPIFAEKFHFEPTTSQILRYLLTEALKEGKSNES